MKVYKYLPLLLLFLSGISLNAKNIALDISYAQFVNPQDESYLEIYFALSANSIDFKATGNGMYQGGAEITVSIKQQDKFIAADKFLLQSPQLQDTSSLPEAYINQVRFSLPKGEYSLLIDIKDVNNAKETYHLDQSFTMKGSGTAVATSDLLFLDSYSKADEKSVFAKSGYNLVPMVSSGSYYFNQAVEQLSFYVEIYNTSLLLGEGEPYVLKYYLQDKNNGKILNKYASFTRKTASKVQPLLASFNIATLKSGNYELIVEALDKEGKSFLEKKTFFYRQNALPEFDIENLEKTDVTNTFADLLGGIDSLYLYTQYLMPISTQGEQNYQRSLLAERDLKKLKQYFYVFWAARNDYDPQAEWEMYHTRVKEVNKEYKSSLRAGFRTDRGRVALVYGKPNIIEQRAFPNATQSYEMWRYDQLKSRYLDIPQQTNKIFVFTEKSYSTNEYDLIHSTALGELYNRRWQYMLSGQSGSDDLDDNGVRYNDGWGSTINNSSIIMQNSGNR